MAGYIFIFYFEGNYPRLLKTRIWLYPKYVTVQKLDSNT